MHYMVCEQGVTCEQVYNVTIVEFWRCKELCFPKP